MFNLNSLETIQFASVMNFHIRERKVAINKHKIAQNLPAHEATDNYKSHQITYNQTTYNTEYEPIKFQ